MNRLRSSRRLETETKRNLEVMWLLGRLSPDHKTIAHFRHENGSALKNVFRGFVGLCVKLGLYGKELTAIDGSKFKAVNSKERNFTMGKPRDRIARLEAQIEEYLRELEDNDGKENTVGGEKNTVEIKGSVLQPESLQDLRLHMYDGKTGAPSSGPYGRRGFLEDLY
jgi:hypothetical protein